MLLLCCVLLKGKSCCTYQEVFLNFNPCLRRLQDVRATELDKVEIYKSFRPGDIVTAEVVRSPTYAFCKKKEYLMYNVPIYIYIYVYISYSCLQILSKHGGARLRCFLQTTDAFSISFFYFFIIRFPWETRVHITYPQQRTNTVSYTRRASRRQQWFRSVGTRCNAPKPR